MSKNLSVKYMKAHLVLLNKQIRKELILSGIHKMKKDDIEKHFNNRFRIITPNNGSKYYIPKTPYKDIVSNADVSVETRYRALHNSLKPKSEGTKKAESSEKAFADRILDFYENRVFPQLMTKWEYFRTNRAIKHSNLSASEKKKYYERVDKIRTRFKKDKLKTNKFGQ